MQILLWNVLFPSLHSQLFGHLSHLPLPVYMGLLENDWLPTSRAIKSSRSSWSKTYMKKSPLSQCVMCSNFPLLSSVRPSQGREGAVWARGASWGAAGDPQESGEESTCVHPHGRRRWGWRLCLLNQRATRENRDLCCYHRRPRQRRKGSVASCLLLTGTTT